MRVRNPCIADHSSWSRAGGGRRGRFIPSGVQDDIGSRAVTVPAIAAGDTTAARQAHERQHAAAGRVGVVPGVRWTALHLLSTLASIGGVVGRAKAAVEVVVDHADVLHERVHARRPHEAVPL